MLIAKYLDNHLIYANHWDFFPNIQFGKNGPTETWLLNNDCYKVYFEKEYNSTTEKLVSSDPYIENGKVYVVTVELKNEEDLRLDRINAETKVRTQRSYLLAETDWMALSDNSMAPEWAAYRQALRDITEQSGFPYTVEWPTKPQ